MGEDLRSLDTLDLSIKYMVTVYPLSQGGEQWELRSHQAEIAEIFRGRDKAEMMRIYDRINNLPHDLSTEIALTDYRETFLD